jgi:hypothetical protein
MSSYQKLMEANPGKYPVKMGQPWTVEEEARLLAAIAEKKTFNQIATEHERMVGGIKARLRQIAERMYEVDRKGVEEIMILTGLGHIDVLKVTCGMGAPAADISWSKEEMGELLKALSKKQSMTEVAAALGRPIVAVEKQRRQLAADYHEIEKLPVEDIQELLNLTKEEVEAAVKECAVQAAPKKPGKKGRCLETRPTASAGAGAGAGAAPVIETATEEPTLAEVMASLKRIEEKLNYILSQLG